MKQDSDYLPCPFCGIKPIPPTGDGIVYTFGCDNIDCFAPKIGINIISIMSEYDQNNHEFINFRHEEKHITAAHNLAVKKWNQRAGENHEQ